MKHVMNKSVYHNGKFYAVNTKIEEDSDGFQDIVKAGHTVELEDDADENIVEAPKSGWKPANGSDAPAQKVAQPQPESLPEAESAEPAQPARRRR